jgi:8-oxo-dGTP diphosphatase
LNPYTEIDIDNYAITLAEPNPSDYVVSNISVDCAIFGFEDSRLKVLLIQHGRGPMESRWALPGDYLSKDLDLNVMPNEVLRRLTGLKNVYVEQLGAFGELNRVDYRRVVTVAYFALISPQKFQLHKGEGASDVRWFDISEVPSLIFDHNLIIVKALDRLRQDVKVHPIGFELLPKKFTLTNIQRLYEEILGVKLDTRNFRRKILSTEILKNLNEVDRSVPYRAPALFSFDKKKYVKYKEEGYFIELV